MKIALLDSGIGLLPAAAAVRRLRPDADLVLSGDPDGMPWGPRPPHEVAAHALDCARAAAQEGPDALVVACNTASVHALETLRAEFGTALPVVGTVPAVKPAAAAARALPDAGAVAVWATPATTGSPYQRGLIRDFADGVEVVEVACPGLADAVDRADAAATAAAVADAASRTPAGVRAVVLGCTHYELVADRIRAALERPDGPPVTLYGSAGAVAAQVLRRVPDGLPEGGGTLTVLQSGRRGPLPPAALAYPEGRLLAASPPSAAQPPPSAAAAVSGGGAAVAG